MSSTSPPTHVLFSHNANTPRLPASVEKLYTTSTALARFGPNGYLSTTVLGSGQQRGSTFVGTLYLRGGGDPTFGSASFDHRSYGTGATMQHLVSNLITVAGIKSFQGNVVADETVFDADRGTPATGNQPSLDVEGELSGLSYNRGWANSDGTAYFTHPALEAGTQFVAALQAAGRQGPPPRQGHRRHHPVDGTRAHLRRLAADLDADRADQHAVGQLLRRDAAQGPGRALWQRRDDRGRRQRRPGPGRLELRHPPAAQRRLRPLAL